MAQCRAHQYTVTTGATHCPGTCRLENVSKKPIPVGYLHIFGIQLTP